MLEDDVTEPLDDEEVTTPEDDNEQEADDQEAADAGDGEEAEPEEVELVDVEYEGKTHRVSPEVRDAIMRHADYTRKTQETAEQRRELERAQSEWQKSVRAQESFADDILQLKIVDRQLAEYRAVDWVALSQQDPAQAQALMSQYTLMRDQRDIQARELSGKQQQLEFEQQQSYAKRAEQTNAEMRKSDPSWTPEKVNKLRSFAKELGFTDHDIDTSMAVNPSVCRILDLAFVGQQALAKQRTTPRTTPKPQPKPVSKVTGGGAKPKGPVDDQSVDAWMKERNRQLRRRA